MRVIMTIVVSIYYVCAILAQDLSNCTTHSVVLLDDGNNFSSSAMSTITFDQTCGCPQVGNCQKVAVEIPSNYTCQGMVASLEPSSLWYDDYFDIYDLSDCSYNGQDNSSLGQKSNYIFPINPIQTGGSYEILICAGEDLPIGQSSVEINFTTSDLCTISDCSIDVVPPSCQSGPFTVGLDAGRDYYTFNINDFVSDDCSSELTYENANLDTSTPNGSSALTVISPGSNDQFGCGTYIITSSFPFDEAGNLSDCAFTFTVECQADVCDNAVLNFDGIDDRVRIDDLTLPEEFTIGCWFRPALTANGGNEDRVIGFGASPRLEVGLVDGGSLWMYDQASSKESVYPINVRDGAWHHIAVVDNGGQRSLYLDFNVVDQWSTPSGSLPGPIAAIGNWSGGGLSSLFVGDIDDLYIYDEAASDLLMFFGSQPVMSSLIAAYDFEDGVPGMDNSQLLSLGSITSNYEGTLSGFDLVDEQSNFVCAEIFPQGCEEDCQADVVILNTGIDFADNSELPIGEYEGGWQLVDGPDQDLSYPLPGYVLNPNSVWSQLDGTQYISPFPGTFNNQSFSDPYIFERCFCICDVSSEVTLDVSAYADNFINIGLYDSQGHEIQELIDYSGPASTSTFTGDPFTSVATHELSVGTYCLRASLRNDGAVTMGMAVQASVTGAGLIENGCCTPFTILTGTVYQDEDCDGSFAGGVESALPNVEVQLCDASGSALMTTSTDVYGYYTFLDIGPGDYTVKYLSPDDQEVSEGSDGYSITLDENSVIGDLDFGVCPPAYCEEDCQADVVDLSTGVSFVDGSLLPIGAYEGGWQMISGPDSDISYPVPGYVLNPNPAWADLPGAQYISPFANSAFNGQSSTPYLFERCFCICEPSSEVTIDVSAYVDNFLTIDLYDSQGNLLDNLIDHDDFRGAPATSTTSYTLSQGTYCLQAGLRNDGRVAMGMAIQASVTGAGLIENGCCVPFGVVSGTVYGDENCDGQQLSGEGELNGVEVVLCDAAGTPVKMTMTDAQGAYYFRDLEAGSYTVKQTLISGLTLIQGVSGYPIDLMDNTVVGDLDFGNCGDPCVNDQIAPVVICPSTTLNLSLGQDGLVQINAILTQEVSVEDNCGEGRLSWPVDAYDCSDVGLNTLTVIATDLAGNTATCDVIINVEDKMNPDLQCTDVITQVSLESNGVVDVRSLVSQLITVSDNCGETDVEIGSTIFDCDDLGMQGVVVVVTDFVGNTQECELLFEVVDGEGLCNSCCAEPEDLTVSVVQNVSVSSLVCLEDGEISLEISGLYDCQQVATVMWGDGTTSSVTDPSNLPSHIYPVNGAFLVSVVVQAFDQSGAVCQEDIVDLPIFNKNCLVSNDITDYQGDALYVYPIPALEMLSIELSRNQDGYVAFVFNTLGQQVDDFSIDQGQVNITRDVGSWPSGTYILILSDAQGQSQLTTRVIKL